MEKTNQRIKYFTYLRKSSEQEDRQVLSIDSQRGELLKIAKQERLIVIDVIEESFSAKAPGRPIFDAMIQRIERGEANAILAWAPNRISRNSVDAGKIIYLMDLGKLIEVKTPGQVFSGNPNDKFLFSLLCSQAKLENDNKGVDVKRGLRRKIEMGWCPGPAPLGYLNTPEKQKGLRIITKDPEMFGVGRKMIDLMLTGQYTVPKILEKATNEWGLHNKKGGKFAKSSLYRFFTNPFYSGTFERPRGSGDWHKGAHEPMITEEEYDKVQILLGGKGKPRPKHRHFPYTGLMQCGECGAGITAEIKVKRQKNGNVHQYTYYHCTKKKNPDCTQKTTEVKNLEFQITKVLESIEIPQEFYNWALECIREKNVAESHERNIILANRQRAYTKSVNKIDALIDMRAADEITEEEFRHNKEEATKEKLRQQELLKDTDARVDNWLEAASSVFTFARDAKGKFENTSDPEIKRVVLSSLGYNLTLKDRKLSISLTKPLLLIQKAVPEVKRIHNRLEPLKTPINKGVLVKNYAKSSMLLPG